MHCAIPLPNDKIIQYKNKLYYGDKLSPLPIYTDLNSTFILQIKKTITLEETIASGNTYSVDVVTIPNGYNIYMCFLHGVFDGQCINSTAYSLSNLVIGLRSNVGGELSQLPQLKGQKPPFNLNTDISTTVIIADTHDKLMVNNGWGNVATSSTTVNTPSTIQYNISYSYQNTITVSGTWNIYATLLLYKIA